ncbi:DUF4307 domain-containing protein [Georgenia yuyongxinii]|uniref:DUF4307 domain-containing protein n=1 Tax=Georgenia yuyongxinii TaxID=2589797 RepID=A0A5B8C3T8_9MICO|nr:DUF4307 domain-containing protein [Georgenia yuyongxinii]
MQGQWSRIGAAIAIRYPRARRDGRTDVPTNPTTPGPAHPAGPVDPAIMAARYRHGAGAPRRGLVVAGVVAVLLLIGAVVLQATTLTRPSVRTEDLGFTVHDATRTSVRFNVITNPGTTVRCTVGALNTSFTEVGFREVVIGPVSARTTSHQVDVTTTELATTGSVDTCAVVDGD